MEEDTGGNRPFTGPRAWVFPRGEAMFCTTTSPVDGSSARLSGYVRGVCKTALSSCSLRILHYSLLTAVQGKEGRQ